MEDLNNLPTRTFAVYTDWHEGPTNVIGNVSGVNAIGALEIQRYGGGTLWTVATFAPGAWTRMEVAMLTDAELAVYADVARAQQQAAMVRQSLTLPGSNQRRG